MNRPDPDQLLAELKSREAQQALAPLKLWFGASPGVGKTCAMLAAAKQKLAGGADLMVGCVETHGRSETAALLAGLPQLPPRTVNLAEGRSARELDLDGALARKPHRSCWWTNWRIRISPDHAIPNAGRMWPNCVRPGSRSGPR